MDKYFTCQHCGEIHILKSEPKKCAACGNKVFRQGLEVIPWIDSQ